MIPPRIDSRIDRSAGPSGCWTWTGTRVRGYGQTSIGTRRVYVHRLVLEDALGRPLARGRFALHHCDNPPCVNPAHLYEGTARDNSQDMLARGRARWSVGSKRPDTTRRHIARLRGEGHEALVVTTAEVADWREADRLRAEEFLGRYADRLSHGDPLPDWVA